MDEKLRSKIRKLLALTQSDNKHESERARVQAKKIMARHGVSSEDVNLAEIPATLHFKRRKPRVSEAIILSAIVDISGTQAYLDCKLKYSRSGYAMFSTTPVFMGPQADAEISAYVWDVLFSQLCVCQKKYRKKGATANEIELYSIGWSKAAAKKIVNAFGSKAVTKETRKQFTEKGKSMGVCGVIKAQSRGDAADIALIKKGDLDGHKAMLHVAASNARKNEKLIEVSK